MDAFEGLADAVRRDILRRLVRGPARAGDLAAGQGISRPAVSRHLRVLVESGLVQVRSSGRERWFRLQDAGTAPVQALLDELRDTAEGAPARGLTEPRRMSPRPTGRLEHRDFGEAVVLTRTFRAPVQDVWAAVTEPDRLQRWIGTWTGDPATRELVFRMTAEGEAAGDEPLTIHECVPPHLLRATVRTGDDAREWHWEVALVEADGVTTLTFAQSTAGDVPVDSVGPGWEYYLDRLVAHLGEQDVSAVDWDRDYFPAMQAHYAGLVRRP